MNDPAKLINIHRDIHTNIIISKLIVK